MGSILRAETTLNRVDAFKIYRPKAGGGKKTLAWRGMRRGVADLHARTELSHKAAGRYLDALASLDDSTRLYELTESLEQPTRWKQKRVRGMRVLGEDRILLEAISRGEFNLNGFVTVTSAGSFMAAAIHPTRYAVALPGSAENCLCSGLTSSLKSFRASLCTDRVWTTGDYRDSGSPTSYSLAINQSSMKNRREKTRNTRLVLQRRTGRQIGEPIEADQWTKLRPRSLASKSDAG